MSNLDAYSFFKKVERKQEPPGRGEVRIDCYLAVLAKFEQQYPRAHFETITATVGSCLSPTWTLLQKWKPPHGMPFKAGPFQQYLVELERQLRASRAAMERLQQLAELVRAGTTVFLVCYEKDEQQCHRILVKRMLEEIQES